MSTQNFKITGTDFVTVPTKNFLAAVEFYGEILGLECSNKYGKTDGAEFETGNLTLQVLAMEPLGLEFNRNRNPIALHVDDVAAARAELESKGISFKGETLDSGVCYMAFFEDVDGNSLILHHRYAPRGS